MSEVRWRRLGWAGVEVEAGGESLVIDHILDPGLFAAFMGEEPDELVAPEAGSALAALLTHLHRDHADVDAIERALASDGRILRPPRKREETDLEASLTGEAEGALAERGLDETSLEPGDSIALGPFTVFALFASDGLGSPQVSWLVETNGARLLHAGDTLWHGWWWDTVARHGPIDVAFLPANGPEVAFPMMRPAVPEPAVLTPEQAVAAALALRAGLLVPIHFDRTFEHEEFYRPVADARGRIEGAAAEQGVATLVPPPGEWHPAG